MQDSEATVDIDLSYKLHVAALIDAAIAGDTAYVEQVLASGVDVNSRLTFEDARVLVYANRQKYSWNPRIITCALIGAAYYNNPTVSSLLLDRGGDVDILGDEGYDTALIAAIDGGRRDIINLLLDRGADMNIVGDGSYGTALIAATVCNKAGKRLL